MEARAQLSSTIIDYYEPFDRGLRWLKTVSSTFLDVAFDGSLLPLSIS